MFTRSDGSISDSCHQATSRPKVMSSRSLGLQCHPHCVTVMERWSRQRRLRSSVTWKVKSRVPSYPQHLLTHAYSGWKLPAASTSSEFTRNVRQARRDNPHSSNGVVKQTCRHYLRHIRYAINQKDGKGTKRYVRSELQEHSTTTDTPCRFQRGTQITIIQNGVAYILILNEWKE